MNLLKAVGLGLTPEERSERERLQTEARARRELEKYLRSEAGDVADMIQRRLVELGICYRYKHMDKRGILAPEVKPINFRSVVATPEAHYLWVETRSMPRGINVAMLYAPDILEALGYTIGTDVTHKASKEGGFWYVVPRKGRLGGIPRYVKYIDALAQIPASAPVLAYPVGMGENKKFVWDDLEAVTNLLIAGSKGGGKSNALNMILCSMIQRCTPAELRLFLVDLKAGMEFIYYAGIPHLGGDVPYSDPETGEEKEPPGRKIMIHGGSVLKMLEYVRKEIDRRGNVMRGKAKKLSVWNKRFRNARMPHWVVVIDELGDLMLDAKYRSDAENLLSRISQLGRAVGIHLILATQTPNKDTVPRLLKNNLDARLAFRCADGPSSQIVVDNYDASYIPKVPGRMLYVGGHHSGEDRVQVQTPFIDDGMVHDVVRRVKGGETTAAVAAAKVHHDVSSDELWRWALDNGGDYSYREVWKQFKKRGFTVDDAMSIGKEFELQGEDCHDPKIEVEGEIYHLHQAAGSVPRKLVLCALCNENLVSEGDADDLENAVESFSEPDKDLKNPVESAVPPTDTPIEWDSDTSEGDSKENEWDSDREAHGENGNGASRDVDGDGLGDRSDLLDFIDQHIQMPSRGRRGRN